MRKNTTIKRSLAALAVFLSCIALSACGKITAEPIRLDTEYYIEDITSYIFAYPDGTSKDLIPYYDISYCKFTDNFKKFTLAFSEKTADDFPGEESWKKVEFAVTSISKSKKDLKAEIAQLVNGRVVRYTISTSNSRIYIRTAMTITVKVDAKSDSTGYDREITRNTIVAIFYRTEPPHAPGVSS